MTQAQLNQEQAALLSYTVSHFQEVARQNRFAENSTVEHDVSRCAICHPALIPMNAFALYLEVVTQSIKVRRPRLDQELVDEMNSDLALVGLPYRVSIESLMDGKEEAVQCWSDWLRDALSTGLGLLSIHSPSSLEFSLEEAEDEGFGDLIAAKVEELMAYQKSNR